MKYIYYTLNEKSNFSLFYTQIKINLNKYHVKLSPFCNKARV